MATDRPRYTVSVEDDLFDKIETFRHENRYQTRSQATVDLIVKGLQALAAENADGVAVLHSAEDTAQSADEKQLLYDYRSLSQQGKEYVQQTMEMAAVRYKKPSSGVSNLENLVEE